MDVIDVIKEQVIAFNNHKTHAIVTIVDSQGTTTRSYGKMLVYEDSTICGTIGGGAIELMAMKDAVECIKIGFNTLKTYDNVTDASKTGKTCGGKLSVFIEVFKARSLLIVCGAGHVGTSVLKLAHHAGFDTLLLDDRDENIFKNTINLADEFIKVNNYEETLKSIDIPENTYCVIATHSHNYDYEAIKGILPKHTQYVGLLGSSMKLKRIIEKLREDDFTDDKINKITCPIGLNLGGETPEEIGISIIAEMIMTRNGINDPKGLKYNTSEI